MVATLAKGNGKNFQSDYSVLTISNASHLDTGYYTCHRADNETISAKQYVFVRGISRTFNLSAVSTMSNLFRLDWHALVATSVNRNFEYGKVNVDIGCRPTHPSIQMSLNQITADGSPVTVGLLSLKTFSAIISVCMQSFRYIHRAIMAFGLIIYLKDLKEYKIFHGRRKECTNALDGKTI